MGTLRLRLVVAILFILLTCASAQDRTGLKRLRNLRFQQSTCFLNVASCVMLLHESGTIGCYQCGIDSSTSSAPVLELIDQDGIQNFVKAEKKQKSQPRILMIPHYLFIVWPLLSGTLSEAPNDLVKAVLLYESSVYKDTGRIADYPPKNVYSSDQKYPNELYNWAVPEKLKPKQPSNPAAAGSQFRNYQFNIFRISEAVANRIRKQNERFSKKNGNLQLAPKFKVESNGRMAACPPPIPTITASPSPTPLPGTRTNSADCLKKETCRPVGGHSVWSSLERVDPDKKNQQVLAITAPLDSTAFFHDLAMGASAEISAVATLMAIVESVAKYRRSERGKSKRMRMLPLYFVFNAQAWGYAGSSRFLDDLKNFTCKDKLKPGEVKHGCSNPYMNSTKFLALQDKKFSVINVGGMMHVTRESKKNGTSTKKPLGNDAVKSNQYFIHGIVHGTELASPNATKSQALQEALNATFKGHKNGRNELLQGFRQAPAYDASQSFRTYMEEAEVVSITKYRESFTNPYFHSQFDNASLVGLKNRQPMYDASSAIAKAVIRLSFGDNTANVDTRPRLIDNFISCLTTKWNDTPCDLAKEYLSPKEYKDVAKEVEITNYAGVFVPSTRLREFNPSGYAKLLLIQKFMAYHNFYAADNPENTCEYTINCTNYENESNKAAKVKKSQDLRKAHCVRQQCVLSDSFWHNAYGTGLIPVNAAQTLYKVPPPSNTSKPKLPVWTESNWDDNLGICMKIEDTALFSGLVLLAGLLTFLFSAAMSLLVTKQVLDKQENATEEETEAL